MRLISFLGKGNYAETSYKFENNTVRTRYIAHALATFVQPGEIHLVATTEAWNQHGAALTEILTAAQLPTPLHVSVPTGGEPEQLWIMFGRIIDSIRTSNSPILLDITHGFRMQPFFAAACIQYVQAVVPNPPVIRVVYGEYRVDAVSPADAISPVWELTPFLDVLSWSRSLMMFLQTGQADAVVEPTQHLARELSKQWATTGMQGPQPQLAKLSKSLQEFSDDFTTIRTGSLLIGQTASAHRLAAAIAETSHEVNQRLPALAMILDQVRAMVDPLISQHRLSSQVGQQSLLALARLYQKMGRYSEAISILREGWITLHASFDADHPGSAEFNNDARVQSEKKWLTRVGTQLDPVSEHRLDPVSELRNDIQHAGFKKQPHKKAWFEEQLEKLLTAWQEAIAASQADTTD